MNAQAFADLDGALPLALLPVRLEARYLPRDQPTELVVRIFPDVIHADGHEEALTEREERAGHAYWNAVWGQADAGAVTAARDWLAGQCGHYRALWVATATTPVSVSATGTLAFPKLTLRKTNEPTRARLLPDQWMVRLYDAQLQLAHTTFSERVPDGLAMAPALAAVDFDAVDPATGKPRDALDAFLGDQGLGWMIDVGKAVDVGMAVRIPIGVVPNRVGALLVTGVRSGRDPLAEGDALDALLDAHWYTRGVDVVAQGTPTNNTDAGRSGVSVDAPDMDELFTRELSERPMAPGGRAVLMAADPALMYRVPAADALSLALGRVRANTFDRTVHAENVDGLAGWAMNVATGYATLGDFIDGPLAMIDGRTAPGGHTPTLRDWYLDWVRGAGPLPAIRCGEQPYGLLPITTEPGFVIGGGAADFRNLLEHHLADFVRTWERSLPTAALDPQATDARPSVTPAADAETVGEVLGAVPHPTSLQLRVATDNTESDRARFDELIGQIDHYMTWGFLWPEATDAWVAIKPLIDGIPTDEVPNATPPDIHTQLARAEEFRAVLAPVADHPEFPNGPEALALLDDDLLPLLEMHRDATERIPSPLTGWSESGGIGSDAVIRLVHTTFDAVGEPAGRLVTTDGDLAEIDELLGNLIDSLDAVLDQNLAIGSRDPVVTGPAPLLHHLLNQNYLQVPIADVARVRLALEVLRAGVNSSAIVDAEAVLERVLRESLGLGIHRIDAWITSLAGERLAAKRRQRRAGIQVGGYGWLLDLEPSDDPTSQGFIHAHSLSHAATAAVLRSGWNAFGTDSGETPLSVDLSSRRARGAQWILDGVRNGQDLAQTLGARFERYLHDDHLDVWIESVRQIVLDVTAVPGPASAVVDGLLIARAWSEVELTWVEQQVRDALRVATAPTGKPPDDAERSGVRVALARVAADLDSVADLTMAQSVHTLLRGNMDAAAGALAVTGGGDATVPPMTVTSSQRDSQLVSHRVVAVWPAGVPVAGPDSILALAEPRLSTWLESLLPAASRVSARVVVRDAEGAVVDRVALTLDDVGLTTLEAAHLAGGHPTQSASRLGRLVAAAASDQAVDGRTVNVELGNPSSGDARAVSVDEFGLMASVAMDAAGRCRALRPEDLVVPGADPGEPVEDLTEIEGRVRSVQARLDVLAAELASGEPGVVRTALLRCAAIDVPGAVVALETGGDGDAVATVVAALADRRRPTEEASTGTAVEVAVERLRRLVNAAVAILPVFTPVADPDRAVSAAFLRRSREVDDAGHRWLRQAGRVRTALGAMNELLLLSEPVLGGTRARYGLVQLPHHDEGWAAISRLEGHRERLAVFSLTGVAALAADAQPIAGLLIDGWTEGIPKSDQLTGIAVHFDAPTARAPNAMLLSVVGDDRGFSAREISEQLLHTLQMAKLRAIAPTGLVEHGHYLPTIFLPDTVEVPAAVS